MIIKPKAEMAPNIDVVFALVVGRVTIARIPFVDQALDRFILISKADSPRNTQLVRKLMSVFSNCTAPQSLLINRMKICFFQRKVAFTSHKVNTNAA